MSEIFELAIVGAGPAGLAAAANAASRKLSHILFEKQEIGNTVFQYQLKKHVMAEPSRLPLRAHLPFLAGSRESVLESWVDAVNKLGINLQKAEVQAISPSAGLFKVVTDSSEYSAKKIILCVGLQGTARKLGVPGENDGLVIYTLPDADVYEGKNILVVGAGDAAIENALALAQRNTVTLINRGSEFSRAKDANNIQILESIEAGKIRALYNSEIIEINERLVTVEGPEGEFQTSCDQILARLGAILPRKFMESCGVKFSGPNADAVPVLNEHFQSSVPGLFVIGALAGYPLIKQAINQGHDVVQYICGEPLEPADSELLKEKIAPMGSDLNHCLKEIREKLPLFSSLSDPQFRELVLESKIVQKAPDQLYFSRNDYTDSFYSVLNGSVIVELPGGATIELSQGDYFGEMSILSGRRRSASVKSRSQSLTLETPRKQIVKLMSSVPEVRSAIDKRFLINALRTSIFPELTLQETQSLAEASTFKKFKKGERLFNEGDLGEALYVIRKGSVKVSRRDQRGHDISQVYIAAGNFVGEMALIGEKPLARSATVTAAVACETIVLGRADFQRVLASNSSLAERVQRLSTERKLQNLTVEQNLASGQLLDFLVGQGITDAENVLIIDSDLCIACDNCEKACAATHAGFSRLDRSGGQSFGSVQVPIACRHCENPLCMIDCPPDALIRRPNGEVVILDSCIGCGNCVRNCPYGVIQLSYEGARSFSLLNLLFGKKAEPSGPALAAKCDMCAQLKGGPACVRSCPTGAAVRMNPLALLKIISSEASHD